MHQLCWLPTTILQQEEEEEETEQTSFPHVERGSCGYQIVQRVPREAEQTGAENKNTPFDLRKERPRGKAGRSVPHGLSQLMLSLLALKKYVTTA